MKRHRPFLAILVAALIVCLLGALLVFVPWKSLVLNFTEKEFRTVFKGYSVRIGSRDITPNMLVFRDINIKERGWQFLKIREFRINFTIPSLLKDRVAEFFIKDIIVYTNFKISEVRGLANYAQGTLTLDKVSARALGGVIEGRATIKPGKAPYYSAALKLKDIQLEKAVEAIELNEKMEITGFASGSLELSGAGPVLTKLEGSLKASPKGGTLTIKNKEWLDAIALYAKKDAGMVMESFKNYHYNEGNASLGLKGTGVIIDAHLNGEAGKRDLLVSLHDFNQKGREPWYVK